MFLDFFHIPLAGGGRLLRNPLNESSTILHEELFWWNSFFGVSRKSQGVEASWNKGAICRVLLYPVLARRLVATRSFQHSGEGLNVFQVSISHRYGEAPLDCVDSLWGCWFQRLYQLSISVGGQASIRIFGGSRSRHKCNTPSRPGGIFQCFTCFINTP